MIITKKLVPTNKRTNHTAQLFGLHFPNLHRFQRCGSLRVGETWRINATMTGCFETVIFIRNG